MARAARYGSRGAGGNEAGGEDAAAANGAPATPVSHGDGRKPFSWEDHFFGAVTVGERGQVVIPADARRRFGIEPGDKILMLADPAKHALMLCKIDALREFMESFRAGLDRLALEISDGEGAAGREKESGDSTEDENR
jgi:looped-hinge helix DNA binding domain, AbrB family